MDGALPHAALTGPPPTPLPAWVQRRPLEAREVVRMADLGILHPDERVELIEGELIRMASQGGPHIGALMALNRLLVVGAAGRAEVSPQCSLRLGPTNLPEPDLALLRPRRDSYRGLRQPSAEDVLLLIEIADTTLRYDREVKAPLYARHGVPEYWIVDLEGTAVLVHRDPKPDGYAAVHAARAGERLPVPGLPDLHLAVADILG